MTETQAPGMAEATAVPVEGGPATAPSTSAGQYPSGQYPAVATGRATVVSRPPTPFESPTQPSVDAMSAPRFIRPPGMPPPPDYPPQVSVDADAGPVPVIGVGAEAGSEVGGATSTITGPRTRGLGTGRLPASSARLASGAARVADSLRGARSTVSAAAGRGPRRARLYIKRIDPWSVMKFSFAVSFVLLFVAVTATAVLYFALDTMGVFDSVNKALADMVSAGGGNAKDGGFKITAKGVIFASALIGTVNVVLFTALATLGAFIYNVCADLVGGIELTLAEKE